MKALVYTGVQRLEIREMPMPVPGDGEVLIRVESVGICGSDMHAYLGHDERRPAPLVLGHEAAGVIVGGARDGEKVTVNPLVTCGRCQYCARGADNLCVERQIISMPPREGAFAEYIRMPVGNLVTIPDGFPADRAALAEPLACGWNAARKCAAHIGEGFSDARALVLGGGTIGVGAALCLTARGAGNITVVEPHEARREFLARHVGLAVVASVDAEPMGTFDYVVDAVGFEATRATASRLVRPGGMIAHIGLGQAAGGLDIRRMTLQEISFVGCYTYSPQDFRETAQAMFDGTLGPLDWVEIRNLDDGAQSFADLKTGAVTRPKIILKP